MSKNPTTISASNSNVTCLRAFKAYKINTNQDLIKLLTLLIQLATRKHATLRPERWVQADWTRAECEAPAVEPVDRRDSVLLGLRVRFTVSCLARRSHVLFIPRLGPASRGNKLRVGM